MMKQKRIIVSTLFLFVFAKTWYQVEMAILLISVHCYEFVYIMFEIYRLLNIDSDCCYQVQNGCVKEYHKYQFFLSSKTC